MPIFSDLLPKTKSNPQGCGIDWTPLGRPGTGTLVIKDRRAYTSYAVVEFPTPWDGRGFLLAKHEPGDEESGYSVFVGRSGQDVSCECRGFLRWGGRCRHIAACAALIGNGWLDLTGGPPAPEPDADPFARDAGIPASLPETGTPISAPAQRAADLAAIGDLTTRRPWGR